MHDSFILCVSLKALVFSFFFLLSESDVMQAKKKKKKWKRNSHLLLVYWAAAYRFYLINAIYLRFSYSDFKFFSSQQNDIL